MPSWYPDLLDRVSDRISTGSRRALSAANSALIISHWHIGRDILDRQEAEGWGAKVIDRLSADLKERFPGATGYSPRNLKYMRAFAEAWPDLAIVQRTVAQLPWRHQVALLDRLDHADLRLWYANQSLANGWSGEVLAAQITSRLHERTGNAITNFATTLPPQDSDLVQQLTKDPYIFDFLGGTDTRNERAVELALVDHVSRFLLELGQGFAYVGRQMRLEVGGDEFFCDLLFYNIKLHRYVVIELKAGKFEPGFLGQLGFYTAVVDDLLAGDGDAPTIGLLLCKSKNNVVVEYALRTTALPLGVAEWLKDIGAVTTDLPAALQAGLPTIAELEAELRRTESRNVRPVGRRLPEPLTAARSRSSEDQRGPTGRSSVAADRGGSGHRHSW